MRIYQIHWHDSDEGDRLHWTHSKLDARRVISETVGKLQGNRFEDFTITPVDVPTMKADLLAWLNAHFSRYSGEPPFKV